MKDLLRPVYWFHGSMVPRFQGEMESVGAWSPEIVFQAYIFVENDENSRV